MNETPDTLLKGALEKIVYFEARAAQLSNDVAQAQGEVEHLKRELGAASQREIELRRVVAELEVRATRAHAEREESARLTDALRRERTELITRMLDASRVHGVEVIDGFDLAQFIAQLRSEVLVTRDGPTPAPLLIAAPKVEPSQAPLQPNETHATRFATELKAQGRLSVSEADVNTLTNGSAFPGRSEETLFGFSVRELSAPDAPARIRAAERLTALAHPAAAPAVATALHGETDPRAQVALLTALATLAKTEALPLVTPLLTAPVADVRIAALKALLTIDPRQAGPHLAAATRDPDKAVRRRASLLALGLSGSAAVELGTVAIRDQDPDVRSLAALVLGASQVDEARTLLLEAMRDADLRVRRSASQALSRLLGHDVTPLVGLDDAHRRREVRRIASLEPIPFAQRPQPVSVPVTAAPVVAAPRPAPAATAAVAAQPARRAAGAVTAVVEAEAPISATVRATILTELRAAIRGCLLVDLADAARVPTNEAMRTCGALISEGAIVRRGLKYFVA
jgi:hypothetical protein